MAKIKSKTKNLAIISLFLFSLFFIPAISASEGNCNKAGYSYCEQGSYGDALAKVYYTIKDQSSDGSPGGGYAIGKLYVDIGFEGDQLYYIEALRNWDDMNCDEYGCDSSSGEFSQITAGDITLKRSGQYDGCPTFAVWDKTGDYWAWTGRGWIGSDNCLDYKVVECQIDSDCSSGQICNTDGGWENWACESVPENFCRSNFDCTIQIVTEKFCEGGDLKEKTTYSGCVNSECVDDDGNPQIAVKEDCAYGCGAGDNGVFKCLDQQTINVYRFENDECTLFSVLPQDRQENDFDTLELCEAEKGAGLDLIIGIVVLSIILLVVILSLALRGKAKGRGK